MKIDGQQVCKCMQTKVSVYLRKDFNPQWNNYIAAVSLFWEGLNGVQCLVLVAHEFAIKLANFLMIAVSVETTVSVWRVVREK